ncbi:GDSL-type esterase/lipase family protein [Pseudonocardia sp. RS010]|uniref:GDSL-type esterase/lipase family protein n=1 Tax=Pseudonocardia sp. RS010 TaxID=3385979 RepID=UPI0039A0C658
MSVQSVRPARALPTTTPAPAAAQAGRVVTTLATLGDSTAVGLGDPLPGGGWRGFPVLLRDALGPGTRLLNPARTGARMADVRGTQLAAVLPARPEAAVICAGMNDTLRSDFDPAGIRADLAATLATLAAEGTFPVVLRYHDHTRVFRLPGRLRAALRTRVVALNDAIDTAIDAAVEEVGPGVDGTGAGVGVLDLHLLPGGYERAAWSVDRLHPSELGHRLLARAAGELLASAGFAVPAPVPTACGGGREITAFHRAAWIVVRGTPWLVRRGRDLGPVILHGLLAGGRAGAA